MEMMAAAPTIADIKESVVANYPGPVAGAFARYRALKEEDLGGRHKNLIDVFEALIKFVTIVHLQEARTRIPNLRERLPQKEKTLEFLKRPSIGGWVGLLRVLCDPMFDVPTSRWTPRIRAWYLQQRTDEAMATLSLLSTVEEIRFERKTKTPIAEICNALVNYRNKQLAHAATLDDDVLERRLPILEAAIATLLKTANFLSDVNVLHAEHVELLPNDQLLLRGTHLKGVHAEAVKVRVSGCKIQAEELYCSTTVAGELQEPPVPLAPFLIWQTNVNRGRPEVFFYNDAWHTKLEYLSYTSSSYYYHHELHTGFEGLLAIKLTPGVEEDPHRFLTPEERAEHATNLAAHARVEAAAGRLEDAIEMLERSLEYERSAETFVQLALIQKKLHEPLPVVQQTLQSALDVDPGNIDAARLLEQSADFAAAEVVMSAVDSVSVGPVMTLFHAFTPRWARSWTEKWWLCLLVVIYGSASMAELAIGRAADVWPIALQFLIAMGGMLWVTFGARMVIGMRLRLSLQLQSMRLTTFDEWFGQQCQMIFGDYRFRDGRLDWRRQLRNNPGKFGGLLAWTIVLTAAAIPLAGLQQKSVILTIIDSLCYLMLFTMFYPALLYAIGTTVFVFGFGRLSIKPPLTRINDFGAKSFGGLLTLNIMATSVIYALYWMLAALVVHTKWRIDFVFLAIATLLFMIWSVGMPLTIRQAMRGAKAKPTHAYAEHIEKAFKAFLNDPDDTTLERWRWLTKHQSVIESLPTWPLSLGETIFTVIGGNIVLIVVDASYLSFRLGRGSLGWLHSLTRGWM